MSRKVCQTMTVVVASFVELWLNYLPNDPKIPAVTDPVRGIQDAIEGRSRHRIATRALVDSRRTPRRQPSDQCQRSLILNSTPHMNLETTDQPSNLIYAERPFFNSRSKLAMVDRHLIITEFHPMRWNSRARPRKQMGVAGRQPVAPESDGHSSTSARPSQID